jgi:hypothetical protein
MTNPYRNIHELVSDLVACALIEGARPTSFSASMETKRVKQLLLDEIEQRSRDLRRANAALVRHGVQEMRPGNADEPSVSETPAPGVRILSGPEPFVPQTHKPEPFKDYWMPMQAQLEQIQQLLDPKDEYTGEDAVRVLQNIREVVGSAVESPAEPVSAPKCGWGGAYGYCILEPGHDGVHQLPNQPSQKS